MTELARRGEYEAFGVTDTLRGAADALVELHNRYESDAKAARRIAEMILDTRRRITNPRTELPDLLGTGAPARASYADLMDMVAERLPENERQTGMVRLKAAVRYHQRDVLVEFLRALRPRDPDTRAILGKQRVAAGDVFAAVVAQYERAGVTLPTDTHAETRRGVRPRPREVTAGDIAASIRGIGVILPTDEVLATVARVATERDRAEIRRQLREARQRIAALEQALPQ